MSTSAKLFATSGGCVIAFVLLGIASNLIYGEREGGFSDVLHFAGLGLAAAAIMLLSAAIWTAVGAKRQSARS